jgi:hypothetical protein
MKANFLDARSFYLLADKFNCQYKLSNQYKSSSPMAEKLSLLLFVYESPEFE